MTPIVALKLGRVSNLPTVWTNTLAATVLAAGTPGMLFWWLALAMSLFYIGGMYLNDAFDARIDAVERPERPIPSGEVSRNTVFIAGFAMLLVGELILLWCGTGHSGLARWMPGAAGLMLCVMIVLYNAHHKQNPLSPVLMGACRFLVYLCAGLALSVPLPLLVWVGALLLFCYLIGLTYVAKQENLGQVKNLWPLVFLVAPLLFVLLRGFAAAEPGLDGSVLLLWLVLLGWIVFAVTLVVRRKPGSIPRAVVSLIAGISLVDALMIAVAGQPILAGAAVLGFGLTLVFQRYIPGT
ncbi:MAG: UbiA family prenyltransferase [Gammaproteobacteria bacterium]|nr:UbiA family prenyltransferase [Gammaproteobacteria bacterium]